MRPSVSASTRTVAHVPRRGLRFALGLVCLGGWTATTHAQLPDFSLPLNCHNPAHPCQPSQAQPDPVAEAQRVVEQIQRDTAESNRIIQEGMDRIRDTLLSDSPQYIPDTRPYIPDSPPRDNHYDAPSVRQGPSEYELALLEEELATARMREAERQQQAEAQQAADEACRILIEAAALSGGQVDLAADNACSRPIDEMLNGTTTYSRGGSVRAPSRARETVIDGSNIPDEIDFKGGDRTALDQLADATINDWVPRGGDDTELAQPSGALERLTSSLAPAPRTSPSADSSALEELAGGGDSQRSGSALSDLVDSTLGDLPERFADAAGEHLEGQLFEDPVRKGITTMLKEVLAEKPGKPGAIANAAGGALAGLVLDKLEQLRRDVMTNPNAYNDTPYGSEMRDLVQSMDPSNLRNGIYTYPKEMLDRLNKLLDAGMSDDAGRASAE